MATRASNRVTGVTRQKNVLGLKRQNENLARPPLPGKVGGSNFLRDTTNKVLGLKRKAEGAPQDEKATKKRSAFGDITNAFDKNSKDTKKPQVIEKVPVQKKSKLTRSSSTRSLSQVLKPSAAKQVPKPNKETTKLTKSKPVVAPIIEQSDSFCDVLPSSQDTIFSSQESNKTEHDDTSHYITASEGSPVVKVKESSGRTVPEGVTDFDKETENDPFAVAEYAEEIFQYYKNREDIFPIDKYIDRQPDVSKSMRSILVDWMVEVQESFELNHETLYLAVKIIDLYLTKNVITRDVLQLVGSTAIFIACKFDERIPPYVDDFLYICDDAYNRKELISMEIKILKTIGYDLGIPLSYRFLRRYARCGKVCMEDLTLARYILELSLMDYELIDASDSLLAAAALFLAKAIKEDATWNQTLAHYSGYKIEDICHLVYHLHNMLCQPPKDHLKTIRNKYSHKVFFEVAKIAIPEKLDI
ncbi:unnamed protein product [Meganyctiphanes norvegica]|uniref:G2/mitotic-specific cyclin-B3 n=1 Tax=Meganyctiphanes norvegica TaxID=48144 RepID=A0AAV2RJD1_MEGNR